MVNEYKKIVLLKGLEGINDYQFSTLKSLLANDLKLNRKMQDEYNRIKIADLMEDKFKSDAGLSKLIAVFKEMPTLGDLAEDLKKEMTKAKRKNSVKKNSQEVGPVTSALIRSNPVKTPETQKRKTTSLEKSETKKRKISGNKMIVMSQEQTHPSCPAGTSSASNMDHFLPVPIPAWTPSTVPSAKKQKTQLQSQSAARGNVLQKDSMTVMVLKATDLFEYESSEEGKRKMFHATVATANQFFQVKVLNTNLKEMFSKKKVLTISNYFKCKGILEVNEASLVSEARCDENIEVPNSVIKRANETPKIDHLHKQAPGTLVYGMFMLQKKKVNKKNTIYEIQDNTGKIDVLGNGKWHDIKCEEGDKLRLFCFQLRTIDKKLTLMSGNHSFIKVVKGTKNKKEPGNTNLNLKTEEQNLPVNQFSFFSSDMIKVEPYI